MPQDPANSWNALDSGLNGPVYVTAVAGADVYVGGSFSSAGGIANTFNIARWDGSGWNELGSDTALDGPVYALDVVGTRVYAAGEFTEAGGSMGADKLAYFDGDKWNSLGTSGLSSAIYEVMIIGPYIFVGGDFNNLGANMDADHIAYRYGGGWSALGNGLNYAARSILQVGTQIYAGGEFVNAGGHSTGDYIARYGTLSYPIPTITSLNPSPINAGSVPVTLYVNGTGFVPVSIIQWDGVDRATTYVSATQLSTIVLPASVATARTVNVTVENPAPGGGMSNAYPLLISYFSFLPSIIK